MDPLNFFLKCGFSENRGQSKKHQLWANLTPFFPKNGKWDFFQKNRALSLLRIYRPLTSCKKLDKKKRTHSEKSASRTHARTDRHEFIGPCRRGGSPTTNRVISKCYEKNEMCKYYMLKNAFLAATSSYITPIFRLRVCLFVCVSFCLSDCRLRKCLTKIHWVLGNTSSRFISASLRCIRLIRVNFEDDAM